MQKSTALRTAGRFASGRDFRLDFGQPRFVVDYIFKLEDGRSFNFTVDPERASLPPANSDSPAGWTELEYCQCPNCPLPAGAQRCCPAALDLEHVAVTFAGMTSFQPVEVEVRTAERTCVKRTDAQTALRSLMGVILATGGCPILSRLNGPARLHLPFASFEETLFRMVGAYLIRQFLVSRQGGTPDWDLIGLNQFYTDLQSVNIAIKRRLDAAAEKDANINAVVSYLTIATLVTMSLDQQLAGLEPYAIDAGSTSASRALEKDPPSPRPPKIRRRTN